MVDEYQPVDKQSVAKRLYNVLVDIWPSIYKVLNNFLFGAWVFIKDTVSSIWRRN